MTRKKIIEEAKRQSLQLGYFSFVYETKTQREFFRFVDSELDEYDLTKSEGKQIRLTPSEQEIAKSWESVSLES